MDRTLDPDEISEGFHLGELAVAVCVWGRGGEERGTHTHTHTHKLSVKFDAPADKSLPQPGLSLALLAAWLWVKPFALMITGLCEIQLEFGFHIGVLTSPQIWDGRSRGVHYIFLGDMGKDNGFSVNIAMIDYRTKHKICVILE